MGFVKIQTLDLSRTKIWAFHFTASSFKSERFTSLSGGKAFSSLDLAIQSSPSSLWCGGQIVNRLTAFSGESLDLIIDDRKLK